MQFPKSTHADGWQQQMPAQRRLPDMPILARDADALSPSLNSRRWHTGLLVVSLAALAASAGLMAADDPRPLDVQLSAALRNAGGTLNDWQDQLSRGLQVSLRAVADGREAAPVNTAAANVALAQAPAALPPEEAVESED